MTLEQTLDQLKAFSEQPGIKLLVNDVEQYALMREKLSAILSESILCQLRARLATVANDNDRIEHESLTLADAAYQVLIALAEQSPANQEDVITLESVKDIALQKLIIVSTGHHFDIEALIERHNTREYQSTRGENAEGKFLYNEMTKLNFSAKDAKRIHQKAAELTLYVTPEPTQVHQSTSCQQTQRSHHRPQSTQSSTAVSAEVLGHSLSRAMSSSAQQSSEPLPQYAQALQLNWPLIMWLIPSWDWLKALSVSTPNF